MREKKAYRFWFAILIPVIRLFYWVRPVGRENFPKGAAVICANHSNWIDPFLIAYALDGESLHMMAKAELFQNFLLKALLKAIGTFPVHREKADMKAVKTAMKYLTHGEKVGIFPEGTRRAHAGEVNPKVGAIKIAEKTRTPIVPVYIPRRKKIFTHFDVVIGEPYRFNEAGEKLTQEDYEKASCQLMEKIARLGGEEE